MGSYFRVPYGHDRTGFRQELPARRQRSGQASEARGKGSVWRHGGRWSGMSSQSYMTVPSLEGLVCSDRKEPQSRKTRRAAPRHGDSSAVLELQEHVDDFKTQQRSLAATFKRKNSIYEQVSEEYARAISRTKCWISREWKTISKQPSRRCGSSRRKR